MATPSVPLDLAQHAINAVNEALRDGFRINGKPSAAMEAARRTKIHHATFSNRVKRAKILYNLEPDLSLERQEDQPDYTGEEREPKIKLENQQLKKRVRELEQKMVVTDALGDLFTGLSGARLQPPRWLAPKRTNKSKERAIACTLFSDLHLDEVVRPEELNWVNGYNREIAVARMRRYFENLIKLCRDYINGIRLDGLVLALGGDMLSGNIHEELKETNEAPILDSILFWSEQIAAGINMLRELDVQIYIPCVVGNHGRMTRKPRAKFRALDNFDWMLYHILAREFRHDTAISFDIPEEADHRFMVYQTKFQLTHGDQFRGGSGIAGMLSPLMLGDHRKRKREAATGQPYDYLLMGHWHQLAHVRGLVINGSLKGYDEYAAISNFDFEPPQQAFWLVDPKWGKTIDAPVHVLGDDEYWMQHQSAFHGLRVAGA